jgi:hypothetical protein
MSKSLTASQIALLENETYVYEYLVQLTDGVFDYRFTTGVTDVTLGSGDASGTWTVGQISGLQSIIETYYPQANSFNFTMETKDADFLEDLVQVNNGKTVLDTIVQVYLLFRDTATNDPDENVIPIWRGQILGVDINYDESTQLINIRSGSDFTNFAKSAGRTIGDLPYAQYNVNELWWGSIYKAL